MVAQVIDGIEEIIDRYDTFLVDLWGVTHNGVHPFPGVLEALQMLQQQKKKLIFLSNAPRRQSGARLRLSEMGISEGLYHDVVTSGEQAHHWLKSQVNENNVKKVFHIGTEKDISLFEGLDIDVTKEHLNVDLLVCSDRESWDQPEDAFDALFEAAAARHLPMMCANSDRFVMYQGKLAICSGFLAERFIAKGGDVTFFGKPHKQIYDAVMKAFPQPNLQRILAIGDSLYTDIQGAHNYGIDSLFICSGIHMPDLGIAWGQKPPQEKIELLLSEYSAKPTFISACFRVK